MLAVRSATIAFGPALGLALSLTACSARVGTGDSGAGPEPHPDASRLGVRPDAGTTRVPDGGEPSPPAEPSRRSVPVSGGTLLVSRDHRLAYVADPDHDAVHVVSMEGLLALWQDRAIELPAGSEPGRLVEDGAGRVHVSLRSRGAIATIERGANVATLRDVCAAPRGLAWREADDAIVVACADGLLVTLPAAGGAPTRVVTVEPDLRDVVVAGDRLLVSRFTSAEVLAVDDGGTIVARWRPASATRSDMLAPAPAPGGTRPTIEMEPHVAWRMVAAPGGAWLLHQRARVEPIPEAPAMTSTFGTPRGYYGDGVSFFTSRERNGCAPSMVEVAISFVDSERPSGTLDESPAVRIPLATDLALSPDGTHVATGGPSPGTGICGGTVNVAALDDLFDTSLVSEPLPSDFGRVTSVAFVDDETTLFLRHSPPILVRSAGSRIDTLVLAPHARMPRGAEIFDFVTQSGLSCASCHPEGGDDGHTWTFSSGQSLRTQSVRGGVLMTEPYHWAGDIPDFAALIREGFVRRMSGPRLDDADVAALEAWLDGTPAPPRPRADALAIGRGRAIFESAEAACSRCHTGRAHTTNATLDVGTGGAFQVAILTAIAYRAPYMHAGCAPTLHDVVAGDPECRGTRHGETGHLSPDQLDDLVAYLRTL